MKKLSFLMAALLVAMTGCQKEPQVAPENAGGEAYMSFTIQTMTTRSQTDTEANQGDTPSDANPDFEVGKQAENQITSVNVVLKNGDKFICATNTTIAAGPDNPETTENPTRWVAKFNSSELEAGLQYDVYVYANCTAQTSLDAKSKEHITNMTSANGFWMTNAYTATKTNKIVLSTDPNTPFDLGTVYVERSMARFDYKPKAAAGSLQANEYALSEDAKTTVTLTDMTLINQSKEFYYLRRTIANTLTGNVTYGGSEIPNNYVVDTDWEAKKAATPVYSELFDNALGSFTTSASTWTDWKAISAIAVENNKDNWTGTATTDHTAEDYYVWCYAKENTIPGKDLQLNGLSTGVVFRGEISSSDVGITADMTAKKTIYVFDNILYGAWDKVETAAATTDNVTLKYYAELWNAEPSKADAANAGFTTFTPTTDGKYYTYYYYWNRHNDNLNSTVMGDMEFAVVRNNVYKLCVDSIAKLGHPDENGADPDPVDPTDPDESGEYYFKVTAKVLPWTVRVNHIEF